MKNDKQKLVAKAENILLELKQVFKSLGEMEMDQHNPFELIEQDIREIKEEINGDFVA